MNNIYKKFAIGAVALSTLALVPMAAFAQSSTPEGINLKQELGHSKKALHAMKVIKGKITTISGTTLTIQNKKGAILTIDAATATVTVDHAASTLSTLAVGDTVMVKQKAGITDKTVTITTHIEKISVKPVLPKEVKKEVEKSKAMKKGFQKQDFKEHEKNNK